MKDIPLLSSLPCTVELTFYPGGNIEVSKRLEAWAASLHDESAGMIRLTRKDPARQIHLPSLRVRGEGESEISYHFVPKDQEEEAFRELLWNKTRQEAKGNGSPPTGRTAVESLDLRLFVANQCPSCPQTVRTLHSLALDVEAPPLSVHLFEAVEDTGLAERYQVKSVPTLLVSERYRFIGTTDPEKLRSLLQAGNTDAFLHEQIRQQIRGGQALETGRTLAEMDEPVFLLEDLARSTFQERIGWLLALDEAMEIRPGCLLPLVEGILSLLEDAETALRGDLADLLGKIGSPLALPGLEPLLGDANPDVAEAAAEAIDEIRKRL